MSKIEVTNDMYKSAMVRTMKLSETAKEKSFEQVKTGDVLVVNYAVYYVHKVIKGRIFANNILYNVVRSFPLTAKVSFTRASLRGMVGNPDRIKVIEAGEFLGVAFSNGLKFDYVSPAKLTSTEWSKKWVRLPFVQE